MKPIKIVGYQHQDISIEVLMLGPETYRVTNSNQFSTYKTLEEALNKFNEFISSLNN